MFSNPVFLFNLLLFTFDFQHRRSWIDDARLTQSQFNLGSESGGNESDNSTEEPLSISSNSHLVKDPSLREKFSR